MKYAELADAPVIYNKAFEGYRMDFLKANFTVIIIIIVILIAALIVLSKFLKKRRLEREAAEKAERRNMRYDKEEE